ncbi:MAG: hypothetical protein RLZZ366_2129 [Pseudomonadota bacterium]|jgi:hypothetical protein
MHLLSMFIILAMLVGTVAFIGSMLAEYGDRILIALGADSQPATTAQIFEFRPRRGDDFRAVEPLPLAA